MLLIWILVHSCSCHSFEKYNSDWLVYRFERYGIDEIHNAGVHNFAISPKHKSCRPMTFNPFEGKKMKVKSCKIEFERIKAKDFMTIFDHDYYKGKFLIECLDKNCCTISLSNDSLYFVLNYNLPYIFGKPRKCPSPRMD